MFITMCMQRAGDAESALTTTPAVVLGQDDPRPMVMRADGRWLVELGSGRSALLRFTVGRRDEVSVQSAVIQPTPTLKLGVAQANAQLHRLTDDGALADTAVLVYDGVAVSTGDDVRDGAAVVAAGRDHAWLAGVEVDWALVEELADHVVAKRPVPVDHSWLAAVDQVYSLG